LDTILLRRPTENIGPPDRRSLWRDVVEEKLSVMKDFFFSFSKINKRVSAILRHPQAF